MFGTGYALRVAMSLCDCIKWEPVCSWYVEGGVYLLDFPSPEICHLTLNSEGKESSYVRGHMSPRL